MMSNDDSLEQPHRYPSVTTQTTVTNPEAQSEFPATAGSALEDDFEKWWSVNHPFDWWTKERGDSLPHGDRLLVWNIANKAYIAGRKAQNDQAETSARSAVGETQTKQ